MYSIFTEKYPLPEKTVRLCQKWVGSCIYYTLLVSFCRRDHAAVDSPKLGRNRLGQYLPINFRLLHRCGFLYLLMFFEAIFDWGGMMNIGGVFKKAIVDDYFVANFLVL